MYNDRLQKMAKRSFKTKLDLWLLDSEQIVLKSNNNQEYTFYNYNLELKFTLNLSRILNESGYRNSIILTGFNQSEIFLYYTAKKTLKKLDRKTGSTISSIELEGAEVRSYLNLKLDCSNSNFIL